MFAAVLLCASFVAEPHVGGVWANTGISATAEAVLTSITPSEIEGSAVAQTKLFTILGTGLGFGKAQVSFTGPREDVMRTVFAFSLNTRVLAIVIIAANPEPGTYQVSVKRGAVEASGVAITITGDSDTTTTTVPGGVSECVPCGDFMPTCDIRCAATLNPYHKCPVCLSMNNNNIMLKYEDGSYYVMESGSDKVVTTYYDSADKVCFSYENNIANYETTMYDRTHTPCYTITVNSKNEPQFILNGKTYTVHEDETWTCPNGTTWKLPETCKDDTLIHTDNGSCPQVTDLPSCSK